MTTFMWLTGGMDIHFFLGTRNPRIGLALLLLYWFVMSMVLLNCLVAIMADACNRVRYAWLCCVVFGSFSRSAQHACAPHTQLCCKIDHCLMVAEGGLHLAEDEKWDTGPLQ